MRIDRLLEFGGAGMEAVHGIRRSRPGVMARRFAVMIRGVFLKQRRLLRLMARYPGTSWRSFRPEAGKVAPVAAAVVRMSPLGHSRILGLDPGSLRTGYGVIDCAGGALTVVAQGCIATSGG